MSTPPPKAAGDLAPPAPVFSYAQAAKGRTPSAPSSVQSAKSPSGSVTPSKESPEASRDIPDILMNGDPTASNGISEKMPKRLTTTSKDVDVSNSVSPEERSKISIPSVDKDFAAKPQNIALPASPSNSVAPPATIPKGDESVSGTQVLADSSSEAKVQTPTSEGKINDQFGKEMDQAKEKDEEKEKAAALKPAPLPTVNFWQQRAKEATQLKSKSGTTTLPSHPVPQSPLPVEGGQMDQNRFNSKSSSAKGPETSTEARRKGVRAVSAGAEADRAGVNQGSVTAVKGGKKSNDVKARDDAVKKSAPRSRSFAEKELASSGSMAPPPVADAMAWPTPETAQDEEKKRAQEKGPKVEKEKGPVSNARPQGKEKWVHVPYTPTAVFNTPLPSAKRGGRQSRGGRENGRGHTSNGSVGGERGSNPQNSTAGSTAETTERGRNESGSIRATSLPPKSTKRSTSAGGSNVREQRKYPTPLIPDRRREEEAVTGKDVESRTAAYHEDSSRRTSIATQTDSRSRFRQDNRSGRFDGANGTGQALNNPESFERGQPSGPDGHAHPKSAGPDRRRESFVSNSDYGRDATQLSQSNTRGGMDRGRGGRHRGRGGPNASSHQYTTTQQVSNGHTFQQPQSAPFSPTKSLTFSYGQPHQQSAQGSQYGGSQRSSRNYRDQSRAQSIPSSAVYPSFPRGPYGGPQQMAPLQTALPPYDFPVHPASAGPYPYAEPVPLVHLVTLQLEYYFSVDNLCKDMFLRKHMDSQGYVFLSVIANFNRIRQLTQDVELIRFAVMQTGEVEFRPGSDGVDRLRRRNGWEQFVLDMAERDESARNEGPSQSTPPPMNYPVAPDAGYLYQNRQIGSPTEFTGLEAGYAPYGMIPGYANPELAMNGMTNGNSHYVETPLSAAVPDFSPSIPPINGTGFASLDEKRSEGDKFTDEQIDSLRIVVRTANPSKSPQGIPFHTTASRTFSNGSIDSRSMAAELNKVNSHSPRPHANGNDLAEPVNGDKLARAASPTDATPQSNTHSTTGPSVFWIKDRTTETEQPPNGSAIEHYNDFRYNTLRERENTMIGKDHSNMNVLFEFWSHFLVRNFNNRMYEEFRALAIEDASQRNSKTGMKHLLQFYDASMSNKEVVMSDTLAQHYVELVQNESYNSDRPALAKMRSAWRNGALNMKTRKKIDSLADKDLKSLLEQ